MDKNEYCKEVKKYLEDCYELNKYICGEKMSSEMCKNLELRFQKHCK